MESPFTRLPNIFLEDLDLDPYEFKFVFAIYRWTIGFQRKSFKLTNVKLSEITGISESKIGKIRKRACKKAEIKCSKHQMTTVLRHVILHKRYKLLTYNIIQMVIKRN